MESKNESKKEIIINKLPKNELLKLIDERVIKLQQIPQPTQRTAEWYDFRNQRLTASDWGTIISGSKYINATRRKIIKKKCNKEKSKMLSGKAIQWGVKYEEVAVKIYEKMKNTKILEFGCLPHPTIPFLGASPDGITIDGKMLEIKCPYSRIISGIPAENYLIQVLGQLEVCELDECDFFECKLVEYDTQFEYMADDTPEYKGCVLAFMTDDMKYKYAYSKVNIKNNKLDKWIEKKIEKYTTKKGLTFFEKTFWYLKNYSCVCIPRDQQWFKEKALPRLSNFWDIILECRKDPEKIKTSTDSPQSSDIEREEQKQRDKDKEGVDSDECLFSLPEDFDKKDNNNKNKDKNGWDDEDDDDECLFS